MYDYGYVNSKPTTDYPHWYCKKCGALFYDGDGERAPIALAHDAWHEKLDRLFYALPAM